MESDLQTSRWESQLAQIGAELRAVVPCAEGLVMFGSAREAASPGDLDLAIIIPDSTDAFEAARALAAALARLTEQTGVLVSCFPISVGRFQNDGSQFIRNVRRDGRPI